MRDGRGWPMGASMAAVYSSGCDGGGRTVTARRCHERPVIAVVLATASRRGVHGTTSFFTVMSTVLGSSTVLKRLQASWRTQLLLVTLVTEVAEARPTACLFDGLVTGLTPLLQAELCQH